MKKQCMYLIFSKNSQEFNFNKRYMIIITSVTTYTFLPKRVLIDSIFINSTFDNQIMDLNIIRNTTFIFILK